MSLIQEALKRKRQEHDAPLSILPDPEQVARQLEEQVQRIKQQALQDIRAEKLAHGTAPRRKRNLFLGVVLVIGVIGVVVGSMLAGGYLITRNPEVTAWNQKLQVATDPKPMEAMEPLAAQNSSPTKDPVIVPEAGGATAEAPDPVSPDSKNSPSQLQGPPSVDPATYQPWPELTIVGVMARANSGRSSAVINNRVVFVNQRIQGVRLIEVQDTGVVLEYKGEQRHVEVGQQPGDHGD